MPREPSELLPMAMSLDLPNGMALAGLRLETRFQSFVKPGYANNLVLPQATVTGCVSLLLADLTESAMRLLRRLLPLM